MEKAQSGESKVLIVFVFSSVVLQVHPLYNIYTIFIKISVINSLYKKRSVLIVLPTAGYQ